VRRSDRTGDIGASGGPLSGPTPGRTGFRPGRTGLARASGLGREGLGTGLLLGLTAGGIGLPIRHPTSRATRIRVASGDADGADVSHLGATRARGGDLRSAPVGAFVLGESRAGVSGLRISRSGVAGLGPASGRTDARIGGADGIGVAGHVGIAARWAMTVRFGRGAGRIRSAGRAGVGARRIIPIALTAGRSAVRTTLWVTRTGSVAIGSAWIRIAGRRPGSVGGSATVRTTLRSAGIGVAALGTARIRPGARRSAGIGVPGRVGIAGRWAIPMRIPRRPIPIRPLARWPIPIRSVALWSARIRWAAGRVAPLHVTTGRTVPVRTAGRVARTGVRAGGSARLRPAAGICGGTRRAIIVLARGRPAPVGTARRPAALRIAALGPDSLRIRAGRPAVRIAVVCPPTRRRGCRCVPLRPLISSARLCGGPTAPVSRATLNRPGSSAGVAGCILCGRRTSSRMRAGVAHQGPVRRAHAVSRPGAGQQPTTLHVIQHRVVPRAPRPGPPRSRPVAPASGPM
jgi:hypothetical protein